MPTFICCGFRKTHSPDQTPARLIHTSGKGGRFQLTARNTDDTETHQAEIPDHIYSVDTLDPHQDVLPWELPQQQARQHRDKGPKCLGVTDRLKKKISSTSGASDEASTRALKSPMSIEEVEVKRKIRRALHSRNEHDEDENAHSEFYDPDAKVIQTPQGWANCSFDWLSVTMLRKCCRNMATSRRVDTLESKPAQANHGSSFIT